MIDFSEIDCHTMSCGVKELHPAVIRISRSFDYMIYFVKYLFFKT